MIEPFCNDAEDKSLWYDSHIAACRFLFTYFNWLIFRQGLDTTHISQPQTSDDFLSAIFVC